MAVLVRLRNERAASRFPKRMSEEVAFPVDVSTAAEVRGPYRRLFRR